MDQQESQEKEKVVPKIRRSYKKMFLYGIVVLAVIGLSSYGIYTWQHKKVTSLTTNLSAANQKVDFLKKQQTGINKQLSSLTAKNNQLNSELNSKKTGSASSTAIASPVASPKLTVAVLGAQKINTTSPYARSVIVDVSLTNASTSPYDLAISGFTLFDEVGDNSADFAEHAGETMSGYVVLNDLTIAPGQTVKGALFFDVFNANYNNYTLKFDSQSYPVSVSD